MPSPHQSTIGVGEVARRRRGWCCPLVFAGIAALAFAVQPAAAQSPESTSAGPERIERDNDLDRRIRQLEQRQKELVEQNLTLQARIEELDGQSRPQPTGDVGRSSVLSNSDTGDLFNDASEEPSASETGDPERLTPASPTFDTAEDFPFESPPESGRGTPNPWQYFMTYDRGFVFRPFDADETPFELKVNGQDEVRFVGFHRDRSTYTDSTGAVLPINNISNFQIPRGRLIFSGYAFRKELLYNLNIDYNTVGSSQINFRAYWMGWRFSEALTLYVGQGKVPGGREWLLSFVDMQGVDRSMATTFFRPSLSQGIWATGTPTDNVFYHVMLSNGFNTLGSTPGQLSSEMATSGSVWWEPLGSFGRGYSDYEWHDEWAIRMGTSLVYAPERGPQGGGNVPENSPIRLSDGTLITATGALAPGVTLNEFRTGLATVDLACKYRGFSVSGEFYSQNLFDLGADGAIPDSSIYQFGGFAQTGYFVVPRRFEPYLRTSYVSGPFGAGQEYAGGFNWFLLPDKQNLQFTVDLAWLKNNPADQNRTNLAAGQTGLLIRSQLQLHF